MLARETQSTQPRCWTFRQYPPPVVGWANTFDNPGSAKILARSQSDHLSISGRARCCDAACGRASLGKPPVWITARDRLDAGLATRCYGLRGFAYRARGPAREKPIGCLACRGRWARMQPAPPVANAITAVYPSFSARSGFLPLIEPPHGRRRYSGCGCSERMG